MIQVSVSLAPHVGTGLTQYRVKPDWLSPHREFQVRWVAPDPAIQPISKLNEWPTTNWAWFSKPWQFFVADLLAMAKYQKKLSALIGLQYEDILRAFRGLTGSGLAFNNKQGTDIYRDYLTPANQDKGDPKWESLIIDEFIYSLHPPIRNVRCGDGKIRDMVQVHSFFANDVPPEVTVQTLKDPRVQTARIIYPNQTFGNFDQLKDGTPVRVPILTAVPCFYPLEELELVGNVS